MKIKEKTIFTEFGTEYKPSELICGELTNEQKLLGLQVIYEFEKPANVNDIIKLLTRLKYTTISKNDEIDNEEIRISIYTDEMLKYPADIANKALTSRFKFFPTLSELIEICDGEVLRRRIIKRKFEL